MKALTCEMCGSTNLIKEEGVYVCQSCGTKYSVEEAKKMMVEGTVEVKGTVKVDTSSELQNLYVLARRAYEAHDTQRAAYYYEKILLLDPNSWEAFFFYESIKGSIDKSSIQSVLSLINNIEDDKEKVNALFVVASYYKDYKRADTGFLGNLIEDEFGEAFGYLSTDLWKAFINYHRWSSGDEDKIFEECSFYCEKIKKYDSSYVCPSIPRRTNVFKENKNGCYIATAVYGSYDCPEVWTLRRFRDYALDETWYGRLFIKTYYAISPTMVKWFGNTVWFKKAFTPMLDRMVARLQRKGVESTPYDDKY